MKNMNDFKSFKDLKKGTSLITEDVVEMGGEWIVRSFAIPSNIISQFKKKAKDSGQEGIVTRFSDAEIAEYIAKYLSNNLSIENLPLEVMGADYSNVQVQPQVQTQIQDIQTQGDVQNIQAQETAQEIPAQEGQGQIQGQEQGQGQGQIQGQGQGQGQIQGQGQGQIQEI